LTRYVSTGWFGGLTTPRSRIPPRRAHRRSGQCRFQATGQPGFSRTAQAQAEVRQGVRSLQRALDVRGARHQDGIDFSRWSRSFCKRSSGTYAARSSPCCGRRENSRATRPATASRMETRHPPCGRAAIRAGWRKRFGIGAGWLVRRGPQFPCQGPKSQSRPPRAGSGAPWNFQKRSQPIDFDTGQRASAGLVGYYALEDDVGKLSLPYRVARGRSRCA